MHIRFGVILLSISTLVFFGVSYSMSTDEAIAIVHGEKCFVQRDGAMVFSKRTAIVGGSLVAGMIGGRILRSRVTSVQSVAQFVTHGHPALFDVGCGAALGGTAWWFTGAPRESKIEALEHQMDASLKQLDLLESKLTAVKAEADKVQANVATVRATMQKGFAGMNLRFGSVQDTLGSIGADASAYHAKEVAALDSFGHDMSGKLDGVVKDGAIAEAIAGTILKEQADTKQLLVGVQKRKSHDADCLGRIQRSLSPVDNPR